MAKAKKKPSKRKATNPKGDDEILALIESLPITDGYTPTQRYQDFRQIFKGSPQGKRVFREMLAWGKLFRTPIHSSPIDPYALAISTGERNISLKLLLVVNTEPAEQQTKATSKK